MVARDPAKLSDLWNATSTTCDNDQRKTDQCGYVYDVYADAFNGFVYSSSFGKPLSSFAGLL